MHGEDVAPSLVRPLLLINSLHCDEEMPLKVEQGIDVEEKTVNRILTHEVLRA